MNPERAEAIDTAKRHAVAAKIYRDKLQEDYEEAAGLTEEENQEWLRKLGKADRDLQKNKDEIRTLYRTKGDDDGA